MTAVPTTLTAVAGAVLTASQWNTNNRDVENWLLAPAILSIRQTTLQSIPNGTGSGTPLTYTTEDVDSTGMHSTSVNTSRATAVYPGWYSFSGSAGFAANATGARGAFGAVNGTTLNGSTVLIPTTAAGTMAVGLNSLLVFLNVGDYFEWEAIQSSGGALNTNVSFAGQSFMAARWTSN